MLSSVNPYNGEVLKSYPQFSDNEIIEKISLAEISFQAWKKKSVSERLKFIKKLSELLIERKYEYGKIISLEMGKLLSESIKEIEKSATLCEYYLLHAEDFLKDEIVASRFTNSYIRNEPLGIILGVMPWNFPFWQVMRFAIPTLIAGNTCLLKHASNVTGSSLAIEKIFKDAGFINHEFQSLLISSSQVETILSHDNVRGVSLTGSEAAGSNVAMLAGKHIKKSVLELGGSDPFIVFDDADLEKAISEAAMGRLINCGQSCISAKRFIVHDSLYKVFIEKLQNLFEKIIPGDPFDSKTILAPLAKPEFADDILNIIDDAIKKGAILHCGNKKQGAFIYPTIISNINTSMRIFHEEVFGPVASVYAFSNDEDAVTIANCSRFGLSASIWSGNINRAKKIASLLETGSVYINTFSKSDPAMPFGGVKFSGYGREMSKAGLLEFVNIKSIIVD